MKNLCSDTSVQNNYKPKANNLLSFPLISAMVSGNKLSYFPQGQQLEICVKNCIVHCGCCVKKSLSLTLIDHF